MGLIVISSHQCRLFFLASMTSAVDWVVYYCLSHRLTFLCALLRTLLVCQNTVWNMPRYSLATRTSLWRYHSFILSYEHFLWLLILVEGFAEAIFARVVCHWLSKWHLLLLEGVPVDGDDPTHVQWIYDKAKERADSFNIQGVTYRLTQGEHLEELPVDYL